MFFFSFSVIKVCREISGNFIRRLSASDMGGQTDQAQVRYEYDIEKLYRIENRGTTQNMGIYI